MTYSFFYIVCARERDSIKHLKLRLFNRPESLPDVCTMSRRKKNGRRLLLFYQRGEIYRQVSFLFFKVGLANKYFLKERGDWDVTYGVHPPLPLWM